MDSLKETADILLSPELSDKIKYHLSLGQTIAKARENAVAEISEISADMYPFTIFLNLFAKLFR